MSRSAFASQHFESRGVFMSLYQIAQRHLTTLEARLAAAETPEQCSAIRLEISRTRNTIAAAERIMR